jgi:hypothetical protein
MKIQHIPYEFIKADPRWEYRRGTNNIQLSKSLKIKGVLSPFIMVQQENRICLVDGFKRYRLISHYKVSTVPAMLYAQDQAEDGFFHGLILNSCQRPLNIIEKSAVVKIVNQFGFEEFQRKIYDYLDIPNSRRFIQKYIEINQLPEPAKEYFHEFQFSFRQLERVLAVSISQLLPWINAAKQIRIKAQDFVSLVEILSDISLRENIAVDKLFSILKIEELINSDWTPQQKSANLKKYLHQKRYPMLHQIQKNIEEHVSSIQKSCTLPLEVIWDKSLERPGFWIKIHLMDSGKIEDLQLLAQQHQFTINLNKLFNIMFELSEEPYEAT